MRTPPDSGADSSGAAPDESIRRTRRRRRRWPWLLLLAAAISAAGLWTGAPQERLATAILNRATGGHAELEGLALWPEVRVQRLALYPSAEAAETAPPLVEALDIAVAYALRPADGRHFPSAHIGVLSLHADASGPGPANYAFLLDRPAPEPETAPAPPQDLLPYLPRTARVDELRVYTAAPDQDFRMGPAAVDVAIHGMEAMDIAIEAPHTSAHWRHDAMDEDIDVEGGVISVAARWNGQEAAIGPGVIQLPGLAALEANASAAWEDGAVTWDGALRGRIEAFDLAAFPFLEALSPAQPIRLSGLDASVTDFSGRWEDGAPAEAQGAIALRVDRLEAGHGGAVYYDGPLELTAAGEAEQFEFAASLNQGQRFGGAIALEAGGATGSIFAEGWSSSDLFTLIPAEHRPDPEMIPWFLGFQDMELEGTYADSAFSVQGRLTPRIQDAEDTLTAALTVEADGAVGDNGAWTAAGNVRTEIEDAVVRLALVGDERGEWTGDYALERFDAQRWVRLFTGVDLPELAAATVDGGGAFRYGEEPWADGALSLTGLGRDRAHRLRADLSIETAPLSELWPIAIDAAALFPAEAGGGRVAFSGAIGENGESLEGGVSVADVDLPYLLALLDAPEAAAGVSGALHGTADIGPGDPVADLPLTLDMELRNGAYNGYAQPEDMAMTLAGGLRVADGGGEITGERLVARLGNAVSVTLADWRFMPDPLAFDGQAEGALDLDLLGPIMDTPGLLGYVTFQGPLRFADGVIGADMEARGFDVAYGDFGAPMGEPLEARAAVDLDTETWAGEAAHAVVSLGQSEITSPALALTMDPLNIAGAWELASDLSLAAALGFADSAGGAANASGRFTWSPEAMDVAATLDIRDANVVLPEGFAAVIGAHAAGEIRYDGGLDGRLTFGAAEATAGGLALSALTSALTLDGESIGVPNAAATAYGGSIRLTGRVGVLAENLPLLAQAELADIDLDAFSRAYEPPGVYLTGRAGGQAGIELRDGALADAYVALASHEGFSMNRDMVQELLLTHHVGDVGGGRALDRVVREVIGPDAQRPFDSASLDMSLVDDRLEGVALLRSPRLNMTVDLLVDPGAIQEAMRLRQQAELERIDAVDFGSEE